MSRGDVAHPLIVPMPRVVPAARRALRWAALAPLRARWPQGADDRLDLVLPSGEVVHLGSPGSAAATVRIDDDRVFLRLLLRGELGAGEGFVAGEWSVAGSDQLVEVLRRFLRATHSRGVESPLTRLAQLPARVRHRRAANTPRGSQRNIHAHYDLGNELYELFLDPETLAYSCAYYAASGTGPALSLAEAQRAKLERLCEWLALTSRDHVLEIGCGWGGWAIHAAQTRGCRVTAITISRAQHALAMARVAAAGVADRVEVQLRDYRAIQGELEGSFDKIVSIEMLEAVGHEYLPGYFARCARLLRPGGRLALQSITMPDDRFAAYRRSVDWMQTYVFPGCAIPSLGAIARAAAPSGLVLERTDDIGPDYAPTLHAWRTRFVAALPEVRRRFDEPFIRTWLLYLAFSEAAFAERSLQNHQLLFVRPA